MIVFIFVLTVLLAVILSWISLYKDKKRSNVSGPPVYPLLGNGHLFAVIDSTGFPQLLKRLEDENDKTVLVYLFSKRYVITADPKVMEAVVTSTELIKKGTSYNFITPWLGDGLLTSTGAKWKSHRKFLTPAFHFNILQNFLPVFSKNGKILKEKLSKMADGSVIDLFPLIALAALDNVTESIMGVSVDAQSDTESAFVKAVDDMSSIASLRMQNPFMAPDAVFNLLPKKKIQDKALKVLHGQTKKVINARREQLTKNNITDLEFNSDHGIKNKHAFLDLLLLAEIDGKSISDKSIREEVDTFMFEGHDTTTSGISYCLYSLSQHEEIQDKIIDELKSILGNDLQKEPSYTDLQQMKYLELVIKESLRLYPSVPMIERGVTEDRVIAGFSIPKDTSVVLDFFNMQRNPEFYEDPLEFRPERFENVSRNPFTWLSFSAGPRNCIGQKFAMLELKMTVSEVVKSFKILPSDVEPILDSALILRSRNGVKVRLLPRN